jgi:hypothetical protein
VLLKGQPDQIDRDLRPAALVCEDA